MIQLWQTYQPNYEKEKTMWDDKTGKAAGGAGDKYVVLQVVLTEKLLGTGSGTQSLTNLQAAINKQATLWI